MSPRAYNGDTNAPGAHGSTVTSTTNNQHRSGYGSFLRIYSTHRSGFTFVEVVVTIGLIALISGVVATFGGKFQPTQTIETLRQLYVQKLRTVQWKSINAELDKPWGIAFGGDTSTMYAGTSYATRDPAYDQIEKLPAGYTFAGLPDVPFHKITGAPQVVGQVHIDHAIGGRRTIDINALDINPGGSTSGGLTGGGGATSGGSTSGGSTSGGSTSGGSTSGGSTAGGGGGSSAGPTADLKITKTGPATAVQGATVTYNVTVTNQGQITAVAPVVTDQLSNGMVFSGSPSGCTAGGPNVSCTLPDLSPNTSASIQFTAVASDGCNCQAANAAAVSTSTAESNYGNNASNTVTTEITCAAPILASTPCVPGQDLYCDGLVDSEDDDCYDANPAPGQPDVYNPTLPEIPGQAPGGGGPGPNLLLNGDFELTSVSPPIVDGGVWQTYTDTPGWDPKPNQLTLRQDGTPASGSQYAQISVPGTVSLQQELATEKDTTYRITFKYALMPGKGDQSMAVYWNGLPIGTMGGTAVPSGSISWTTYEYTVLGGDTASSSLGFGCIECAQGGNLLDVVAVQKLPTFGCSDSIDNSVKGVPTPPPSPADSCASGEAPKTVHLGAESTTTGIDWSSNSPPQPTHAIRATIKCGDGFVVTGLYYKDADSGNTDAVDAISAYCSKLNDDGSIGPPQSSPISNDDFNGNGNTSHYDAFCPPGAAFTGIRYKDSAGFLPDSDVMDGLATSCGGVSLKDGVGYEIQPDYSNSDLWGNDRELALLQCPVGELLTGFDYDQFSSDFPQEFDATDAIAHIYCRPLISDCEALSMCSDPAADVSHASPTAQCSDHLDNDSDSIVDYPNDPGCMSPLDQDEQDGSSSSTGGASTSAGGLSSAGMSIPGFGTSSVGGGASSASTSSAGSMSSGGSGSSGSASSGGGGGSTYISLQPSAYKILEGGTVTVSVNRSGDVSSAQDVHVFTADNTATAGNDYTAIDTTVHFNANETTKTVDVHTIDDTAMENDESFFFGGPSSYLIITIAKND